MSLPPAAVPEGGGAAAGVRTSRLAGGRAGEPLVHLLTAEPPSSSAGALRLAARALSDTAGAGHASRSYRFPLALVALHTEPVGVDLERDDGFRPEDAPSLLTPSERGSDMAWTGRQLSSIWSSKEALAKALGNALDYDPRRLPAPALWPGASAGRWRAASLPVGEGHVGWVVWQVPST